MNRTALLTITAPLLSVLACSELGSQDGADSRADALGTVVLTCSKLTVSAGKTDGPGASALATKDLSGTTDQWNKYVEFEPGAGGASATCTYRLPAGTSASAIASLALRVNYRGLRKAEQAWLFEAPLPAGGTLAIGDNGFARDWTWSAATLPIGSIALFTNGEMKVTYRTTSNADVSQLDEMVVLATLQNAGDAGAAGDATPPPAVDAGSAPDSSVPPDTDAGPGTWWKPSAALPIHWHWQLSDAFTTPRDLLPNVSVYDIDGEQTSAQTVAAIHAARPNTKVICYFDAGVYEGYRSDKARFPASVIGKADVGWDDSFWLDIRQLDIILPIMKDRMLNWCKNKGFDAIEPDETEVWSNDSGFPITKEQNVTFNRKIAELAHSLGLSVGLKGNNTEAPLLEPYFDWALTEQCWEYDECGFFKDSFVAKGKAVFNVEYSATPNCTSANSWHINSSKRDLNLVGPTNSKYLYNPCVPDSRDTWQ
jgi:hypothetical protein